MVGNGVKNRVPVDDLLNFSIKNVDVRGTEICTTRVCSIMEFIRSMWTF